MAAVTEGKRVWWGEQHCYSDQEVWTMVAAESIFNWAACPVLESVPGKLGGAWVFRGTRVPYTTVLNNISDMDVDEIAESFPSVRRDQIVSFLEFVARSAAPHS